MGPCHAACRCDTAPLTHAERHAAEAHIKAFLAARGPVVLSTDPINVGIYFHVISNSTGHGNISDSAIAAQIAVLNSAFAGHFNFTLLSTDRTVSNQWFVQSRGSPPDLAAKQALSKGSRRHLNVYTAETVGFLGWAWLPSKWLLCRRGNSPQYTSVAIGTQGQANAISEQLHSVQFLSAAVKLLALLWLQTRTARCSMVRHAGAAAVYAICCQELPQTTQRVTSDSDFVPFLPCRSAWFPPALA